MCVLKKLSLAWILIQISTIKCKNKVSVISKKNGVPAIFKHGESPVWDVQTNSLYFVDVLEQNVHRLNYTSGVIDTKHIRYGEVNIVLPIAESHRVLVAVRASLYVLDWTKRGDIALRIISQLDIGRPDNILNDGKADALGRFWGGTKGPQSGDDVEPDKGTFYKIDQHNFKHPEIMIKPVTISNGLIWALNNTVMYYVDSGTKKIDAYDFDLKHGEISNRRTILAINDGRYGDKTIFDGLTIDSNGNLWAALMFGGKVLQINPNKRQVDQEISIPASRVTSVCWGGPNMDVLFVTTGQEDNMTLSGSVFSITDTGFKGVPSNKFIFDHADTF